MGFLRSEDMYLYKFVLPKDTAWQSIRALGYTNAAHFIDMNRHEQPYKLPYTDMVKRCEESERRLMYSSLPLMLPYSYLAKECKRYRVSLISPQTVDHLD